MALEWLRRDNELKDHALLGEEHFGTEAPSVMYERRPVLDPQGTAVGGLYSAWIILNNPSQYNSYTTEMVKAVIAGFQRASSDREIVAVVFTAVGDKAYRHLVAETAEEVNRSAAFAESTVIRTVTPSRSDLRMLFMLRCVVVVSET